MGFTYPIGIRSPTFNIPPLSRTVSRSPSPRNGSRSNNFDNPPTTVPNACVNASYFVIPVEYPTKPPVQLFSLDTPESSSIRQSEIWTFPLTAPTNPPVARDCGSGFNPLPKPRIARIGVKSVPIKEKFWLTFVAVDFTDTSDKVRFLISIGTSLTVNVSL